MNDLPYELALELKNAGFPQITGDWHCSHHAVSLPAECDCKSSDFVKFPTLSELIAVCGDKLMSVHRTVPPKNMGDYWCAESYFEMMPDEETPLGSKVGCGRTPEEAVAKLWLSLKQKSDDRSNL